MANWFQRLLGFGDTEEKSYIDDFRYNMVYGGKTSSGVHVSSDTAMQITTVYACVRVISESIAQLPVHVIKRERGTSKREKQFDHQVYRLFGIRPNSWQTPFEFIEMMVAHCLLRGNFYAQKVKASDGRVLELIPLHPDGVTVEQMDDFSLIYRVSLGNGQYRMVRQDDMFHVRGIGSNGFVGLNPINLLREAIGLAKSTERHGATLFGNGAKPGGILKHPGKMTPEAQKTLKESWGAALSGENANKTAILEEGMEWVQMGMTSEDSQFLETRKFQRGEIASIFRVPPHKIGDLEHATFSNIEHQSLEFVQDTLLPWIRRIEDAVQRDIMPLQHRNTHYLKFNVDSILRGDIKTRFEAYATAIQWGILNPDEARELEDRNPRPDGTGKEFLSPLNMAPASQIGQEPDEEEAPPPDPEAEGREETRNKIVEFLGKVKVD